MSFKKVAEKKKEQTSWLDPVESTSTTLLMKPVKEKIEQVRDGIVWTYKGQIKGRDKDDKEFIHKLPFALERAVLTSYDFQNWFETIWMVLNINNRWTCNDVLIPDHLVDKVGATKIGMEENIRTGQIIWTLRN